MKFYRLLVAILGLIFSAFGIYYNAVTVFRFVSKGGIRSVAGDEAPYFASSFILLTTLAVIATGFVLFSSVTLLKSAKRLDLLVKVLALEFLLSFVVGGAWLIPFGVGRSVAAASGISLGGLMPQMFVLLPLVAVLSWLNEKTRNAMAPDGIEPN